MPRRILRMALPLVVRRSPRMGGALHAGSGRASRGRITDNPTIRRRYRAGMAAGAGPDLIGRRPEIDRVTAWLDLARAGPACLLVRGDAGIGKTAVWEAA